MGRQVHCGLTYLEAVRKVLKHITYKKFKTMAPEDRKAFIREIIIIHKDNRKLYIDVLSGNI